MYQTIIMHIKTWFAIIMQATLSCFWLISFAPDFVNMSAKREWSLLCQVIESYVLNPFF